MTNKTGLKLVSRPVEQIIGFKKRLLNINFINQDLLCISHNKPTYLKVGCPMFDVFFPVKPTVRLFNQTF